jgi:transcriptional regulator with XRE-family HTH domain
MPPRKTMTFREWRESKGWTQRQAGEHFGWSQQRQGQLERDGTDSLGVVDYVKAKTGGKVTRLDWPEAEYKPSHTATRRPDP